MSTILALALYGADNDAKWQRQQEELRVHDALCSAGLDSLFLHTLVPIRRAPRKRTETVAYDPVPMLPGYALVRSAGASPLAEIGSVTYRVGRRRVRAIKSVVGSVDQDQLIPLLAISGRVARAPAIFGLKVGDRVRVVSGLLADLEAVIEHVQGRRAKITVSGKSLVLPMEKLAAA